jgi:hypothetical protein
MSQIAFFTRDGDMRDGRSRISRPKEGALIRATILNLAPWRDRCCEPLHDPVISKVQTFRSLVPVSENRRVAATKWEWKMKTRILLLIGAALMGLAVPGASAQDDYDSWAPLRSTFESTGGGGIMIKGYDPVVLGNKCVTTFMAVTPAGRQCLLQHRRV